MQKKFIALAVAGLVSGAAFAQSNVTIYGVVDAGYVLGSGDNAIGEKVKTGGIQTGILAGSRIGFKGEEGLGNGLKAIFTLEYALTFDENSGIGNTNNGTSGGVVLDSRQTFVGLSSAKLGTLTAGRQYLPGYGATIRNSSSAAQFDPQSILSANAGNTITPNSGARANNSIAYMSPNFSGFTGSAVYSFGENVTSTVAENNNRTDNGTIALGANYANGPLNLDLVYQSRQNRVDAVNNDLDDINEWYLGGAYDFKVVKLMASYQNANNKFTDVKNKIWQVGAAAPIGVNGTFMAGYSRLSWNSNFADNSDSKAWSLAYKHALSKRTALYAGYVRVNNDDNAVSARMIGQTSNVAGGGGAAATIGGDAITANGEKNSAVFAGLNHSF